MPAVKLTFDAETARIMIESYIANEPFRGQQTSKRGWNSHVCGEIVNFGDVGINNRKGRESFTTSSDQRERSFVRSGNSHWLAALPPREIRLALSKNRGIGDRFSPAKS